MVGDREKDSLDLIIGQRFLEGGGGWNIELVRNSFCGGPIDVGDPYQVASAGLLEAGAIELGDVTTADQRKTQG
jgi:hypothetical protein